jgi:hypothetical protein
MAIRLAPGTEQVERADQVDVDHRFESVRAHAER